MSIAVDLVDVDKFKVPYAIAGDEIFHIKHGRPAADSLACPICGEAVSFVKEIDVRAAHFRHHNKSGCEQTYAMHRDSMHNAVRDAAVSLLNGRYVARDVCAGQGALMLPTGLAVAEQAHKLEDTQYVPDITVFPKDGERACTLELEVVWSHQPTPARMHAAARRGHVIGVMNISSIEQSYMQKLWRGERFDIPEACKAYVLEKRFKILNDVTVRRDIRGILDRKYMLATVRPGHQTATNGAVYRPMSPHQGAVAQPRYQQKTGTVDDIFKALRACKNAGEVNLMMSEYETAIDEIAALEDRLKAARATHIRNEAKYIMTHSEYAK